MKGKILAITAKKETKIECFFLTRDCSYSRTEVTHGVSQQHVVHRSVYDHCVNQASPPGLQTALAKTNRFSLPWGLTLLKPRLGANRHKCLPPPLPPRSCCRPARSRGAARGSGGGGGSMGQLQAARVVGLCSACVGKRLASVIPPRDSARPAPKHREFWTLGEDVRCLISGLFTPSCSFWRSP